jgi:hypothetical protein
MQSHTIALPHVNGKTLGLLLQSQRCQTRSKSVILQRHRRPEHRHDPVTGELVYRATEPLHHCRALVGQFCHDLA